MVFLLLCHMSMQRMLVCNSPLFCYPECHFVTCIKFLKKVSVPACNTFWAWAPRGWCLALFLLGFLWWLNLCAHHQLQELLVEIFPLMIVCCSSFPPCLLRLVIVYGETLDCHLKQMGTKVMRLGCIWASYAQKLLDPGDVTSFATFVLLSKGIVLWHEILFQWSMAWLWYVVTHPVCALSANAVWLQFCGENSLWGVSGAKYELWMQKVCALLRSSENVHLIVPWRVMPIGPPIPEMLDFVLLESLQKS